MKESNEKEVKLISRVKRCLRTENTPVGQNGYSLYYDHAYNRIFVKAELVNTSDKTIKSLYADIESYDDADDLIGVTANIPLTNVMAAQGEEFGFDNELILNYLNTSYIRLSAVKAVFDDGAIWRREDFQNAQTIEIPEARGIDTNGRLYPQLVRELELAGIKNAAYIPEDFGVFRRCTCGSINSSGNGICSSCGADSEKLRVIFDEAYLEKKSAAFESAEKSRLLEERYETAKVRQPSYEGYTDAYEKMKELGAYKDAAKLAETYKAEALRIKSDSEKAIKEEIYASRKVDKNADAAELRAAAARLLEIKDYKDSQKIAEGYMARAYALEKNAKLAEKQKEALIEKENALRRAKRKKILLISLLSVALVAVIVGALLISLFWLQPVFEENDKKNAYKEAQRLYEKGKYTDAINTLTEIENYDDADKLIKKIKLEVAGNENAVFASTSDLPCYTITKEGAINFSTSSYWYTNGIVTIPDVIDDIVVKSFSDGIFNGADWIKEVVIPANITVISASSFKGCTSLKTILLREGITAIGDSAFENCSSLETIEIPDSVLSLGTYAFSNCSSLTAVRIPSKLQKIPEHCFNKCSSLKTVTFGSNLVLSVGRNAFAYCSSLESIELTGNINEIGGSAFAFCSSLKTIKIPSKVDEIGANTFKGCGSLTEAELGNAVSTIANAAFYQCTSLVKITLPVSLTQIGYEVFDKCDSLKTVIYQGTEEQWSTITVGSANEPLLNAMK